MLKVTRKVPTFGATVRIEIAVVGGKACGKSCLVQRLLGSNPFLAPSKQKEAPRKVPEDADPEEEKEKEKIRQEAIISEGYNSTMGCEMYTKAELYQGEKLPLNIWDVGGHERFRPFVQVLMEKLRAVVLLYDMTSEKSFTDLVYWRQECLRLCPDATILLVGTKGDRSSEVKILPDDVEKQAKLWGCDAFMVSAKTNSGVEVILSTILTRLKASAVKKETK